MVGQARQGKSRLIQALTGLGPDAVPTSPTRHCTAVAARFANRPGPVAARVRFQTEASFLADVLAPYYEPARCGLPLGPAPASLAAFAGRPLPPLPASLRANAAAAATYEHLGEFHRHAARFGPLLGSGPRDGPGPADLRQFVAQVDPGGRPTAD